MPRRASPHAALGPLPALLALLALSACGRDPARGRVVVLGFDGLDPDVVALLADEGRLPHFARLSREGARGRLQSSHPMLSPILWTTVATGRRPEVHGIGHFVATDAATGRTLPVTSGMRRAPALWNVFSEADRTVGVVGWWATWPSESVRGAMVSDHLAYHFLFEEGLDPPSESTANTHPKELESEIAELVTRPRDVGPEEVARFADVPAAELDGPFSFEDDLSHLRWAIAAAETHRRIGLHLWHEDEPDLLMVYVEATDTISHLFGHLFRARGLSGELLHQQERFGGAVEEAYVLADEILGDYVEAMDEDTTLVVLSDHGFTLGALHDDPSKTRDLRRVSEKHHEIEGVIFLHGRAVRPGVRLEEPTLLDVAPTVLALAGLPVARDMPGRVLDEALEGVEVERVGSHGLREDAGGGSPDPDVDPAIVEKLRSLGYVGVTSEQTDRNMAALAFEQGRHEEAVEAYRRLVRASPRDASLRASLAGALGALGRHGEALEQLEAAAELDPLRPEIHHNRGAILERQGRRDAAVEAYRTALRYAPGYEPSRRALVRLTGSADTVLPRGETEERAAELATEASVLARRGDYEGAARALAEAEAVAPDFALVHHYRANVAFLRGDLDEAEEAMERALELEPDNALFRENLERLRRGRTP